MKNILLLLILITVFTYKGYAQFQQRDGGLKASMTELRQGKINGLVTIEDIYYPDSEFRCLEPLGKPIKIEENVSGVGSEYIYCYPSLTIAFHNTNSEQKMTLSYLQLDGEYSFLSLEGDKNLKTGQNISRFVDGAYQAKKNNGESTLLVPFYNAEGSKLVIHENNDTISAVKIWF
jgi:hypothetical protein